MKKHSGATTTIKSLINYGLVYQGKDGLYHVSDDCEQMLRDGKFRSHDTSASSNGIVAESALSALVKRFDALLAEVRAWKTKCLKSNSANVAVKMCIFKLSSIERGFMSTATAVEKKDQP
nr:hypothetical protein [uncultured Providencia sp.]